LSQSESSAYAGDEALVNKHHKASDTNLIALDPSVMRPEQRQSPMDAPSAHEG
jgi:hypothetical protein